METLDPRPADVISEAFVLYRDSIAGHCRRFMNAREGADQADDVVQDTFMNALDYLNKGKRIEHMKTFLYSVANHLLIDRYRKQKDKKILSLDMLCEQGFDPGYEDLSLLQNKMDAWQILNELKHQKKAYALLHMRYMKGMQYQEISEITGLKSNLIAVTLHRLMKRHLKKVTGAKAAMNLS
ncbi:MAG: sigma-70 family RNA polymerase sigma factor [Candidatus Peribacteraceae bacterium]|nr:sigma-70 family RNA polymerase sigma factor [Candidatus Peribacteraceae bacterium]